MSTVLDFGHFDLGSAPTFTFVFKRSGITAAPSVPPVLNVTLDGVKTTKTLTDAGDGTYTWSPLLTDSGVYTATIYAPAGAGETAQPFVFVVDKDENYP